MGVPVARIFGIEIRVSIAWAIVLAVVAVLAVGQLTTIEPGLEMPVAWALGGVVAAGFFLSSVLHDLAHALVARRRGVEVSAIGVSFFGGSTPFDPASPDPRHDIVIAASGPLASLGIGVGLLAVTAATSAMGARFDAVTGVLAVLVFLNLVLGLVNLVPAYPLDGGRIVRDLAWLRSGSERRGWQVASLTGRVSGFVVIAAGIVLLLTDDGATGAMLALTGWFLVLSANALRDRVQLEELVGTHSVAEAMEPDPVTVTPTLTVDTFAAQLLDGGSPLTAVPVLQGDEVVGLLGVRQVRAIRRPDWLTKRVEEVMVRAPKLSFLAPTDPLKDGLERVHRAGLDGLPVLEEGRLVGMLTRRSVGAFLRERRQGAAASRTGDGGEPGDGDGPGEDGGRGAPAA